jgi:hypothetical protein
MINRCHGPKAHLYEGYGGRGITVCDRWRDKENGFLNFLSDLGKRPDGMSIERKNVMGNYEPSNCVWADRFTQANNRRTNYTPEELAQFQREADEARRIQEDLEPF